MSAPSKSDMYCDEVAAERIFEAFSANGRRPITKEMLKAFANGKNPEPGMFGKQESNDADNR